VAAAAPAVALYDQQQANMALQLVDAFSDLSVTAARFAGSMKAEQNEEDIKAGMDLVNKSRKSYQKLVESGEIKPTENPWMAVGAQSASGTLEGMKARVEFERIYALKSQEDPKFFDSPEAFDALAAQYVQNANVNLGDGSYQTRSFYEAFNPYIASKAMQHEEAIAKFREERILTGLGAEVSKAVQDFQSVDPVVQGEAISVLQERMDTLSGVSQQTMNKAVVDYLVEEMKNSDNPEAAEEILNSLRAGTGLLKDTDYAKARLGMSKWDIERNRNRMTEKESLAFADYVESSLSMAMQDGNWTEKDMRDVLRSGLTGEDAVGTFSPQEMESKFAWGMSRFKQMQDDQQRLQIEARTNAANDFIDRVTNDSTVTYESGLEDLQEKMEALDMPTEERWAFKFRYDKLYEDRAGYRIQKQLQQETESFWKGDGTQEGALPAIQSEVTAFLQGGNLPRFSEVKNGLDALLAARDITPDREQAKAIYGQAYSRMQGAIEAAFTARYGSDLRPQPNDTPDTQFAKAQIRGQKLMLEMQLGMVMDDRRVVSRTVNEFVRVLNPVAVEGGNQTLWPVEDMISAYSYMMLNNLNPNTILPGGENGKALADTLAVAAGRLRNGENLYEIARDVASQKFFGESMKVSELAFRTNNTGWANLTTGNNKDLVNYNEELKRLKAGFVTNSDSEFYSNYEFQRYYLDALGRTKDHSSAIKEAKSKFWQNNMSVRGSLIPRGRGLPSGVDEVHIEAWLDLNYADNPDATLVVVSLDPTGQALFAVRDQEGRALKPKRNGVEGTPRIYRPEDIASKEDSKEINRKIAEIAQEKRAKRVPWWLGQ